ncbi:G-alpha-domain-containing protein [Tricholoma matsutake]|nr:G-alpha-domain-containing protein [Tricholoma matsutake 945]
MGGKDRDDPFAIFHIPPPNETPEERTSRERREAQAQRVSDHIDDAIKLEKAALKKQQRDVVKVLLLGQSESGKSTTLKNFRMKYARAAWKQERASWRTVIQLNLIRSIITIVETLQVEMDSSVDDSILWSSGDSNGSDAEDVSSLPMQLTEKHQLLKLRLGPLRRVEADLKKRLGSGTEEIVADGVETSVMSESRPREFGVRALKDILNGPTKKSGALDREQQVDEATEVIVSCQEDMKALWTDELVRAVLTKRRMRVEDSAGFFLDDLDRIATRNYEPSDDDIVRARLRTVGVQEYIIRFGDDHGTNVYQKVAGHGNEGPQWVIYDVGGSRTMRHAWLPYFENVNAIIFLAPVSCFDERLLEDASVNRLEDSFLLWRAVCTSKLLQKTTLILFLNKCDLLRRKLKSGTRVQHFLPSYGDRPNNASTFVTYLKLKFKDVLRQSNFVERNSYFYATCVTDTKATATTLTTVRDSILREHLKQADLV